MACHSHFHGVTACVKNNYVCFEFPSIFLYKLSDTFFYKNIPILVKFDISDNKKVWIRTLKRNVLLDMCFSQRDCSATLYSTQEIPQTSTSALHLLISYFTLNIFWSLSVDANSKMVFISWRYIYMCFILFHSNEKKGNSNCAGDLYLCFPTAEIKAQKSNIWVFFLFFFF